MAEIFGAVAGALSISGLFNNCIDCFDYIQIARNFGQDFSRYQLRLDVAKCRLARWGEAIDINNDPRFGNNESTDRTVVLAQEILEEIVARFKTAYKISNRYRAGEGEHNREFCTEADLDSVSQRLHNHFRALTTERYKSIGLVKKTSWALYDKKYMGRMIDDITISIGDLEKTFPATSQAISQLVELEIEEVNDTQELEMIQDIAEDVDPLLSDSSKHKLQHADGKNSAGRITGSGKVGIGHTFVKESFMQAKEFTDSTVNHVDIIDTTEASRVNIGNTYGGKGFWD
ncbi:hypothetical protein IL306_005438 [Fusarium sp. DS 682]|nr:hypothetical protein IL306_005438 [Fusarium sp. DS 682]